MTEIVYYYDADSKILKRWTEGTPLHAVVTLRSMVGTAFAFDADGYVVGSFTDDGQYQGFPVGVRGVRHISQYGSEIPLRKKPDQLNALPDPDVWGDLRVNLWHGGRVIGRVMVRCIETRLGSKSIVFGGKGQVGTFGRVLDYHLLREWRGCAADRKDWTLDATGSSFGLPGPVLVHCEDVPSLLFQFVKEQE